jgi:hypothetical protein
MGATLNAQRSTLNVQFKLRFARLDESVRVDKFPRPSD